MKTCSRCKIEKHIEEFFNVAASKDGKTAACKQCTIDSQKVRYEKNKRAILDKQREYYQRNKARIIARTKQYTAKNKERISAQKKLKYLSNRDAVLRKCTEYAQQNKEKIRRYYKKYSQDPAHRRAHNESSRKYLANNKSVVNRNLRRKWRENTKFRLKSLMSCRIRLTLKGGKSGRSWESLVGYTAEALEKNLKRKIPKGYRWKDFIEGRLHIDHKTPVAVFNYKSFEDTDFKRCWAMSNLQLLPAKINIAKGHKLSKPFQPSLDGM